jgi:hypothetical protein
MITRTSGGHGKSRCWLAPSHLFSQLVFVSLHKIPASPLSLPPPSFPAVSLMHPLDSFQTMEGVCLSKPSLPVYCQLSSRTLETRTGIRMGVGVADYDSCSQANATMKT